MVEKTIRRKNNNLDILSELVYYSAYKQMEKRRKNDKKYELIKGVPDNERKKFSQNCRI